MLQSDENTHEQYCVEIARIADSGQVKRLKSSKVSSDIYVLLLAYDSATLESPNRFSLLLYISKLSAHSLLDAITVYREAADKKRNYIDNL